MRSSSEDANLSPQNEDEDNDGYCRLPEGRRSRRVIIRSSLHWGRAQMLSGRRVQSWLTFSLVLSIAVPGIAQAAGREPVLKQIGVPHSYYYREMYLPQPSTGPSAVAWSPDGSTLVYSMQGRLWRQRLGTEAAEELTQGNGYDFQPDWSPDGKSIV